MTVRSLGLPLRDPRTAWLCAAFVFVVLASTTSRSIGLFDEGELAVAAYELGLGHPTGQPLHTLLGYLFAHLPFVSVAHGLTLLSAAAAALSVVPAFALAERALPEDARRFLVPVAVVSVALHGVLWEPSTRIEVYPLASFFGVMALAHAAHASDPRTIGILLGLSASANPVVAVIAAVSSLAIASLPATDRLRAAGRLVLGLVLGLAPYLYLGVAATRSHSFVWGGLDSFEELAHYLGGRDYRGNLSVPIGVHASQLREFVAYLAGERGFVAVFATLVLGLAALAVRAPRLALASAIAIVLPLVFVTANAVFAVDVPDYLGYCGFGFLAATAALANALDETFRRSRVGAALVVALIGSALVSSPFAIGRTRASDDVTERLGRVVLDEAPAGAIVVLESDHLVAPLLYLQRVERLRPDVVVVIRGLMASSWYLRLLADQHPTLGRYAIRGPGARDGRIRRLLDANPDRAVRLEHLGLAQAFGLVACPSGLTFAVGARCTDAELDLGPIVRTFARAHRLPSGAVDAARVVPAVALHLALDLERTGANRAAYTVLVAGLPDEYRGTFLPPPSVVADGRPLVGADPAFRRRRSLGDSARNAFVAARMLADAGQLDAAIELVRRAAADGMPEANELLSRAAESPGAPR